jgi:hypothetical protein
MRRPFAATLLEVGAKTRAGGGGYQPTVALGVQARTSAMMGCRGGINGRVDWLRGVVVGAGIELVLQRAARALFLDGAG